MRTFYKTPFWKPLIIFAESLILDVWQGSQYASGLVPSYDEKEKTMIFLLSRISKIRFARFIKFTEFQDLLFFKMSITQLTLISFFFFQWLSFTLSWKKQKIFQFSLHFTLRFCSNVVLFLWLITSIFFATYVLKKRRSNWLGISKNLTKTITWCFQNFTT